MTFGNSVAVKDNVCVAGVPMMNGSRLLGGFVPATDASIITRLLDAGAEIVGKAICEAFCFSAGSHTSDPAPVLNPHDPTRSAGGSSSGSAALVASRACDMAIGGDQGGSIRIPAALCGIVGLKPTWGLVPYTGIVPIGLTIDHTGPMARTTRDCALLLDVIAGPDGLDPRQSAALQHGKLCCRIPRTSSVSRTCHSARCCGRKPSIGFRSFQTAFTVVCAKGLPVLRLRARPWLRRPNELHIPYYLIE